MPFFFNISSISDLNKKKIERRGYEKKMRLQLVLPQQPCNTLEPVLSFVKAVDLNGYRRVKTSSQGTFNRRFLSMALITDGKTWSLTTL